MDTHSEPPLPLLEIIRDLEKQVRSGMENSQIAIDLRAELDKAGYQIHESDSTTWCFFASLNAGKRSLAWYIFKFKKHMWKLQKTLIS